MRKDSYTLRFHTQKDFDLYNAYNIVFSKMSEMFTEVVDYHRFKPL